MLFNFVLAVFVGLIAYFCCKERSKNIINTICKSVLISVVVSLASLVVLDMVIKPMFNLQTYCESEPSETIELVSVLEPCKKLVQTDYVEVVNILNAGKKFVVTDGEFYWYCCTYQNSYPNAGSYSPPKVVIIKEVKITSETQVTESNSPYAGAGVMNVYLHKYKSWWANFSLFVRGIKRRVFSIPAGTLGKGKIIIPNSAPVFVPSR